MIKVWGEALLGNLLMHDFLALCVCGKGDSQHFSQWVPFSFIDVGWQWPESLLVVVGFNPSGLLVKFELKQKSYTYNILYHSLKSGHTP